MCLTSDSFETLTCLLNNLLDSCLKQKDWKHGSCGLIAGSLFYMEDFKSTRRYMEQNIKKHKFFRSFDFWRSSLILSLTQRSLDEAEPVLTKEAQIEFVLQWVISNSHQMLSYEIPYKEVKKKKKKKKKI
jgi:hypothetical protein